MNIEQERREFLEFAPEPLPGYWCERQEREFAVWCAAKASAIPPGYKLVKIDPEWDSIAAAVLQNRRNLAALKGRLHTFNTALTDTQQLVFQFIKDHITNHGRPPTRQDIATHFKWKSPNAAEDHLKRIAGKGFIVLHPGRACGIEVVSQLSTQHQQGQ